MKRFETNQTCVFLGRLCLVFTLSQLLSSSFAETPFVDPFSANWETEFRKVYQTPPDEIQSNLVFVCEYPWGDNCEYGAFVYAHAQLLPFSFSCDLPLWTNGMQIVLADPVCSSNSVLTSALVETNGNPWILTIVMLSPSGFHGPFQADVRIPIVEPETSHDVHVCLKGRVVVPDSKVFSFDKTLSLGSFPENSSPHVIWTLHNKSANTNSVEAVQRTCGCLRLEYGEETVDGVRWRPVTGAADESFPPIPPGGSAQLRVSIAPFGRIGPFAKNVYVKISDSEKPVVLTVTGDSRPLLEASPLSPLVVGTVPRGAPTDFRIEVTPSDPIVVAGTPYVTNAVCPASCTLDTNAIPWILSVTLSPQPDHRGPVGCAFRSSVPPAIVK